MRAAMLPRAQVQSNQTPYAPSINSRYAAYVSGAAPLLTDKQETDRNWPRRTPTARPPACRFGRKAARTATQTRAGGVEENRP